MDDLVAHALHSLPGDTRHAVENGILDALGCLANFAHDVLRCPNQKRIGRKPVVAALD